MDSVQLRDVDGDGTAYTPGLGCIRICIQSLNGGVLKESCK